MTVSASGASGLGMSDCVGCLGFYNNRGERTVALHRGGIKKTYFGGPNQLVCVFFLNNNNVLI